ncbi:orotidine-5'-phosphate decarboxylase [Leptospira ilyithenensis]|uniref:Orotidine-5'-phosphate decarboxylase n=1 Tax=Leptospira ilyithenensis TaxID=2484901 RepID=A0A4R9LX13_9LEPT|nr:orotidine-5'-phosphate decarboxylase [Leptospira ilyithenensis]TGN14702.1 orotidine-5'-phosphate decarboxylase [Leptospira ilyithenensis]
MSNVSKFQEKFIKRREELSSLLCIGLDPEWEKLPFSSLKSETPLFHFSKEIVEATHTYATSWKPNVAFFERFGSKGFKEFELYVELCKTVCPEVPIIADAKRGDLANTSKEYAKYYFETLGVDALTVNAYMGRDTLLPYLDAGGYIFILCLTSNPSSSDLQKLVLKKNNEFLYEEMSDFAAKLGEEYPGQVGIVVGGTHPAELKKIRNRHPDLFFLIPGYGAQGASLEEIYWASGKNSIINSSRGVTLLSREDGFSRLAKEKALEIQTQMNHLFH